MIKKGFLLTVMAFICVMASYPISAYKGTIILRQPNGDTLIANIKGDENTKWLGTKDGFTILQSTNGSWNYAVKDSTGQLVASSILAKNPSKRDALENKELALIGKNVLNIIRGTPKKIVFKKPTRTTLQQIIGKKRGLVILIGFVDNVFTLDRSLIDDLFNNKKYIGLSTGSVRSFFLENSIGQLDYSFDVVGPFVSAQPMSYYGGNDLQGDDNHPEILAQEAVIKASESVDFSKYDNDNDGYVDNVHVIFAGYGEEAGANSNAIWSHKWQLPVPLTFNGKKVSGYSCSPEFRGNSGKRISPVGVHCHEFSHTLGVPDFYDTDYDKNGSYDGTGDWDLMASGSWNNNGDTPAHINGYAKTYLLGWCKIDTLKTSKRVTILCQDSIHAFMRIDTKTPNEFFLLENRQLKGFDSKLPHHGMIIYRIHSNMNYENNDLNNTHPQKCYPLCASSTYALPNEVAISYGEINSGGCPFPGNARKTSLTDFTTPSTRAWTNMASGTNLDGINEKDSTISFDLSFNDTNTGTEYPDSTNLLLETFSNGLPSNWQQEYIKGLLAWSSQIEFQKSFISLEHFSYAIGSRTTKLATQEMQSSSYDALRVKIDYLCKGSCKIYWKSSTLNSEEWIADFATGSNWQSGIFTIKTPGEKGQLIFEGICNPGDQIGLDQVKIWGMKSQPVGINEPTSKIRTLSYILNEKTLTILANRSNNFSIYAIDGRTLFHSTIKKTDVKITLPKGVYILSDERIKEIIMIQ